MPTDDIPPAIRELADARATARRARDWATADRIRGELEEHGWRIVDAATLYTLERALPPDVVVGGVTHHGSSASVPSRLGDAPTGTAGVVLVATDGPAEVARSVAAVRATSPGAQLVVVANGASDAQAAALTLLETLDPAVEVVWLASRLGHAAALNAGIRRIEAPVVILLGSGIEPRGDLAAALAGALEDPTVAVCGPFGLVSDDLRRFEAAPEETVDVDVIDGAAMAFRRADYVARGPIDEHFTLRDHVDTWWSLVLRDQGDDDPEDAAPRRAVTVHSVMIERHPRTDADGPSDDAGDRLAKKQQYRVLKRFATRRDLLAGG
jgi:hypothetical protein